MGAHRSCPPQPGRPGVWLPFDDDDAIEDDDLDDVIIEFMRGRT